MPLISLLRQPASHSFTFLYRYWLLILVVRTLKWRLLTMFRCLRWRCFQAMTRGCFRVRLNKRSRSLPCWYTRSFMHLPLWPSCCRSFRLSVLLGTFLVLLPSWLHSLVFPHRRPSLVVYRRLSVVSRVIRDKALEVLIQLLSRSAQTIDESPDGLRPYGFEELTLTAMRDETTSLCPSSPTSLQSEGV